MIYKSMEASQHNLSLIPLVGSGAEEGCVEANGLVKGVTMGFNNFSF